jgi:putative oxidoreductase
MKAIIKLIDSGYALFLRVANSLQSPLLLAIRLYWGWLFFSTGWGKLHNMAQFVDFFTSLGLPAPWLTAHFVALLETTGGILLFLGLGSRLIAVPLVINMLVAFLTTDDREALAAIFSDPSKLFAAAPYTYLFASLIILVFGPGFFSLDTFIKWYRGKNRAPQNAASAN